MRRVARTLYVALALFAGACGGDEIMDEPMKLVRRTDPTPSPWASELVRFDPGEGAGYGADQLPEIVLGPPITAGTNKASLDVVSLGIGGEIELGFGTRVITDGEGPDFVVFENAFWVTGDPTMPFAEPGEVSVSDDGSAWHTFSCTATGAPGGRFPGCAGWTPTFELDAWAAPLDPTVSGGDAFDLATIGLSEARFVRVRDRSDKGTAPNAGHDLDAIGLVHWR